MEWPEQPRWTDDQREVFYQASIVYFLAKFEVAKPQIALWAARLIIDCRPLPLKSMAVRLRTEGRPLTPSEKRERGLPVRLKIGETFADALTPAGCADPAKAAEAIAAYPIRAESRVSMAWLIRNEHHPARMIIYDDDGTCAAARPFIRQILAWQKLPSFPLPECDKMLCRCNFDRAMHPRPATRVRHRKPKGCATAILLMAVAACAVVSACAMVL